MTIPPSYRVNPGTVACAGCGAKPGQPCREQLSHSGIWVNVPKWHPEREEAAR